jgi:hypothetical protein
MTDLAMGAAPDDPRRPLDNRDRAALRRIVARSLHPDGDGDPITLNDEVMRHAVAAHDALDGFDQDTSRPITSLEVRHLRWIMDQLASSSPIGDSPTPVEILAEGHRLLAEWRAVQRDPRGVAAHGQDLRWFAWVDRHAEDLLLIVGAYAARRDIQSRWNDLVTDADSLGLIAAERRTIDDGAGAALDRMAARDRADMPPLPDEMPAS